MINFIFFENILKIIIYSIMLLGLWFLISPLIKVSMSTKRELLKVIDIKNKKFSYKNRLLKHIERVLSITYKKRNSYSVLTFLIFSISIFIVSFMILSLSQNITFCFIFSLFFALTPYIFLRIKLNTIRVESSYDAVPLITEISNNYKINYLNMNEAIHISTLNLKQLSYTKNALSRMAFRLKQYNNQDELEDIIQEFNYSINTQWSINLSNSIYLSIAYNYNVNESLKDILNQLGGLKRVTEKNKQMNNESFLIMKYIGFFSYIATVILMFTFMGFTVDKFIDYQFLNAKGLKLFCLIVASMIFNYIIYLIVRKPKNDF